LTQTGSGKVKLPPSLERNVAVMFGMTEPHSEQILGVPLRGASEGRSAVTIRGLERSKIALGEIGINRE
jgi:hypothetical protein